MSSQNCCRRWLKGENLLLVLTIFGVVCGRHFNLVFVYIFSHFKGISLGLTLSFSIHEEPKMSPRNVDILRFPGTLFLRALKLLILPLMYVFNLYLLNRSLKQTYILYSTSSLINSMVNLNPKSAGKIG
jgi:hypothetical protein